MSISTAVNPQDISKLISGTIKHEIEHEINKELMEYITPKVKTIAKEIAENVVKQSMIQIYNDIASGDVKVMVKFTDVKGV